MDVGKILLQARSDFKKFTSKGGFQLEIKITTPDNSLSMSFFNLYSQRHLPWESDGSVVNAKLSHVSIIESDLPNYPVRNPRTQEVNLKGHKITVINTQGIEKKYVITEAYPSDTLGVISCIIGPFKDY